MLAKTSERPFDSDRWYFEVKWDGYRVLAVLSGGDVSLYSRNKKDLSEDFPGIAYELSEVTRDCVLDGEIVYLDNSGKPDFYSLNTAGKLKSPNIVYYVFDILYLDGYELISLKLRERKSMLEQSIPGSKRVKINKTFDTKGIRLFEAVGKEGLEGIIAKKKDSVYRPGERSGDWLKIKYRNIEEFLVGGFKISENNINNISSLLIGKYEKDLKRLKYFGKVASGLEGKNYDLIKNELLSNKTDSNPFKDAGLEKKGVHWVRPGIIVQVEYLEKTGGGHLRHPSLKGIRLDKGPEEITVEKKEDKVPESAHQVKPHRISIANPEKIYWPEKKYTKKDLIDYYLDISDYILPYIKDRPQSLNRYPDGIYGKNFYQKDIRYELPEYLQSIKISHDDGSNTNYLVCNGLESLVYMVNLGCIEINPWSSRIEKLEYPDFAIIDLDPGEVDFRSVVSVAKSIKAILDKVNIRSYIKTSGASGLHIYIPTGAKYKYSDVLDFVKVLVKLINNKFPDKTSTLRDPKKRLDKVYLDFLQNRFGQTVVAPYSVRPRKGASVSTPLEWSELEALKSPDDFNIKTVLERIKDTGDIWKDTLGEGIDILESIANIRNYFDL